MKRRLRTLLLLLLIATRTLLAQNSHFASSSSPDSLSPDEETDFITTHFPLKQLCKWTPGMKFMFIPDSSDEFVPILCKYEDGKEVDNDLLKSKTLEYTGSEETVHETYIGKIYTSRFIFQCEDHKYYYEMKDVKLNDLCDQNPYASIPALVYLQDVNKAKELLIGKTLYTRTTIAKTDDANSYSGYRKVNIAKGEPVKITTIDVGNKSFPVKITFIDRKGVSYYIDVAMSRTNSGMEPADFQAEKRINYFPNAFSFTNPDVKPESLSSPNTSDSLFILKRQFESSKQSYYVIPHYISKMYNLKRQEHQLHSF